METKQMYVADVNAVFGKEEEPLIKYVDDIVVNALTDNLVADSSERTKYFFDDVRIRIIDGEYVLSGLVIKDTVLDVMSEYSREEGLKKTNKHFKSSPYSLFMIYLKNHRMILVKNQNGSPDLRGFQFAFRTVIGKYIRNYNDDVKGKSDYDKEDFLPYIRVKVTGIKTASSVMEALVDVEKVTELTLKFYPLNSEWDYGNIFGDIDGKIRRVICSGKGKMTFPSPKSISGVASVIEQTDGLVRSEMKVKYKPGTHGNKKTGKIKDNEITDVGSIEIDDDLDCSYETIGNIKKEISSMNVATKNNVIDYEEYITKNRCD